MFLMWAILELVQHGAKVPGSVLDTGGAVNRTETVLMELMFWWGVKTIANMAVWHIVRALKKNKVTG